MVMASGRKYPFLSAAPDDIDFRDLAEMLARLPRFAGATEGAPYSVAQHSVLGLDHCTAEVKPYFLLHDAHEAALGDWITPLQWALQESAARMADTANLGMTDQHARLAVRLALGNLKEIADRAIHARAGLEWPRPAAIEFEVRKADRMMLGREVRWLVPDGPARRDWLKADPLLAKTPKGAKITPWPWATAAEVYAETLDEHLPALRHPAAAMAN
ncbi:hypothetical protein CVT23_09155 [Minwuia thermotolerans]|uniref:Uncharacterized protein n=2 Tax=Minwuia thermotolerans TaxID=2056226 RepID=A0A2M9G2H7_9PROT|nr:hypothetical protein CVT23_09155 [Minwuia thermotolerans]